MAKRNKTHLLNKFRRTDCPFYDFVRENGQITVFSQSRNWQENATVDFSIIVLKIVLFCVCT